MKITEYHENGKMYIRNIPFEDGLMYYYGEGRRGREGVAKIEYHENGKRHTIDFRRVGNEYIS